MLINSSFTVGNKHKNETLNIVIFKSVIQHSRNQKHYSVIFYTVLLKLSIRSIIFFSHLRSVFPVQDDLDMYNIYQCHVPHHNDAVRPGLLYECLQSRVFR